MNLVNLHSLWVGPRLDYLERLCLSSARAMGHNLTLWSYEPDKLEGVPNGTDLRNAEEVMPRDRLLYYRDSGSVALGANLWRIELLSKGMGCWVDMDFIFLRPFDFGSDYIFGWENENSINNAVMMAPANSKMVLDLRKIPQPNRRPPWWGPKKSLQFYWRRLIEGRLDLEDYPWGTFGPGLITHVVKSNNLGEFAQSREVFYPVKYEEATDLYGPAEIIEARLTESTRAIHLWHSRLAGLKDSPPPRGSFIDVMCRRFGVDVR